MHHYLIRIREADRLCLTVEHHRAARHIVVEQMIVLVVEDRHGIVAELPIRLSEDVKLSVHQLQVGAGDDRTAAMLSLGFLHALQRQFHLLREPHVVVVAEHVIVCFHIAQHPHERFLRSKVAAGGHGNDAWVGVGEPLDESASVVGRSVVAYV